MRDMECPNTQRRRKLEQLEHEMDRYKWNVLGIAEMRWLGNGEMTTEKGHKIWFSGMGRSEK